MRWKIIAGLLAGCTLAAPCAAADYFLHTEYKYVSRKHLKPALSDKPEDIYEARKALETSRYNAAKESCAKYENNNKDYCEKEKDSEHMKLVRQLEEDYKAGRLAPPADPNGAK